jgi:hypothetical protein
MKKDEVRSRLRFSEENSQRIAVLRTAKFLPVSLAVCPKARGIRLLSRGDYTKPERHVAAFVQFRTLYSNVRTGKPLGTDLGMSFRKFSGLAR